MTVLNLNIVINHEIKNIDFAEELKEVKEEFIPNKYTEFQDKINILRKLDNNFNIVFKFNLI